MPKLTQKAGWILLSDGGAKVFGFLTTIYLARVLGAEFYGGLSVALSVLGIASWFTDFGINKYASREVALTEEKQSIPASSFFQVKVILSLSIFILSTVTVWFFYSDEPLLRSLILLFLLSLVPQSIHIDWFFHGVQKFNLIAISRLIQAGMYLLALILLVQTPDFILWIPVIYSITVLIGSIILIGAYQKPSSLLKWPNTEHLKKIVRSSSQIGLGSFLTQIVILLPPIFIDLFIGREVVGFYSVAFKLILMVMIADRVLITLLLPNLTHLWSHNKSLAKEHILTLLKFTFLIGCAGSLILTSFSSFLIHTLFGQSYSESVSYVYLLSLFIPVTFIHSVFSFSLIAFGQNLEYLKATLAGGIPGTLIMLLAATTGQIFIVIASILLAEGLFTLSSWIQFKKNIPVSFSLSAVFITFIFAGIFMGITLSPLDEFVSAIGSLSIFAIVIISFRFIKKEELTWFKERILS